MEKLLTLAQVAEQLQISERTLRHLVRERRIECVRIGRLVRFRPEAVAAYVHECVRPPLVALRPSLAPPDDQHADEVAARHRLG